LGRVVRLATSLSIVVVSHDSAPELSRLIASVTAQLGGEPQLVVVDTASTDDSVSVARSAGAEVLELDHNPGFGPANNLGLRQARGSAVALLNPDVELLDDGLLRLAELACQQDLLVVPRLVGEDGRVEKSAHPVPGRMGAFAFALLGPALPRRWRLEAEPWRRDLPVAVGWAVAAALVARADVLRDLGPFDPNAFLFYEDLDLCLRAARRGVRTVLHPEVVVRHRGAHSTAPAFGGEPLELLARRRREVIATQLGRRSLALDDAAQAVTFMTRAAGRILLLRSPARPKAQLGALRRARRRNGHP
jgi:N-acetylglucosaminyl-diphospho-decaprenol L-rhamnosyltransferase